MKVLFSLLVTALLSIASNAAEAPICPSSNGATALIVIDMQPGFVTRGGNDKTPENKAKVEKIIAEQVAAINHAKEYPLRLVV